jgi:3-oxoacyl-[acyl-carrier protein] reductase
MASSFHQRFAGKKFCVSGGTRGIGRAVVDRLLSEGAFVCFSSRTEDAAKSTVAELAAIHGAGRVVGVESHLGRDNRVALVERAVEVWGGEIHGLVLNAAVSPPVTSILEADERAFEKILSTNVTANALLVQAAVPHFAAGDAAVVFISSISAYAPAFPHPVYGAVRFPIWPLQALREPWRMELGLHALQPRPCVFPGC